MMSGWKYPGEHILDGVTYSGRIPRSSLMYIRDEMEMFSDDILVASYPKTGTTWMQEIVWQLSHGPGSSDKRNTPLSEVFPFMEENMKGSVGLDQVKNSSRPRFIKTHLQSSYFKRFLENTLSCPKVIIVLRNPKDVLVSLYHFHKTVLGNFATWDCFFDRFKSNTLQFGDYFDHSLSWWQYRDHEKVLIVKYSDMIKDPHVVIGKVAQFLDMSYLPEDIQQIANDTSFESMKSKTVAAFFARPAHPIRYNSFFRKGTSGSWKTELFTEEQINYVDERMANICKMHTITFD